MELSYTELYPSHGKNRCDTPHPQAQVAFCKAKLNLESYLSIAAGSLGLGLCRFSLQRASQHAQITSGIRRPWPFERFGGQFCHTCLRLYQDKV